MALRTSNMLRMVRYNDIFGFVLNIILMIVDDIFDTMRSRNDCTRAN